MTLDFSLPVLVVDDYQTIICNLLKQIGFSDIDEASDGSAALTRLKSRPYGLVITDWNIQPMTGYELLRHARAEHSLQTILFIMVTAESRMGNVIAAKNAGVSNYIVKPLTI